jgi:hypothetical protein
MRPQPRVRNKIKHTSVVTTVTPEIARHSPRNGFNGFLRALPGDRACLSPSLPDMARQTRLDLRTSANLTPASRRQDHTTSPSAESIVRRRAIRSLTGLIDPPCHPLASPDAAASTASRPTSVTIAKRPSEGRDGGGYRSDLGRTGTKIFSQMGLDRQIGDLPVGQIFPRTCLHPTDAKALMDSPQSECEALLIECKDHLNVISKGLRWQHLNNATFF